MKKEIKPMPYWNGKKWVENEKVYSINTDDEIIFVFGDEVFGVKK